MTQRIKQIIIGILSIILVGFLVPQNLKQKCFALFFLYVINARHLFNESRDGE